jgi:hypothetical protein
MRLTEQSVLDLCRIRDPFGVVSVYAETTPERQAHATPEWLVSVRNGLRDLRQRSKEEGPRERWVALHQRLDDLEPELERLLDPAQPGRGMAVFAPVTDDRIEHVSLQMPLRDAVVCEPAPYVRPLVVALDEGRPAGVAIVDRSGVRLLEWRFGETEEVEAYDFSEATSEWRELKGPAPANPAMAQQTSTQRDLFEERLLEHVLKYLKEVGRDDLPRHVKGREWDRIVIAGDPRLTQPLVDGLRSIEILHTDHELRQMSPREVARHVQPVLEEAQRRREVGLVETTKERALSGGSGALGLRDTLAALGEGRVQHLVYDDARDFEGFRTPDGLLLPDDSDGGAPEPHLVERMIERTFETSGSVTPVEGPAAELLESHGGVGAILRW